MEARGVDEEQNFGTKVKAEEGMLKGTHRWKEAFGFYWVGIGRLYVVGAEIAML